MTAAAAMHKGRSYPFALDRWAITSQFWPGFIPRKIWLQSNPVQSYPWIAIAGMAEASTLPTIDAAREAVAWDFTVPAGYTRFFLQAQRAGVHPHKKTAYNLVLIGAPLPSPANARAEYDAPLYSFGNSLWLTGNPVLPNLVFVPPLVNCTCATWAQV